MTRPTLPNIFERRHLDIASRSLVENGVEFTYARVCVCVCSVCTEEHMYLAILGPFHFRPFNGVRFSCAKTGTRAKTAETWLRSRLFPYACSWILSTHSHRSKGFATCAVLYQGMHLTVYGCMCY